MNDDTIDGLNIDQNAGNIALRVDHSNAHNSAGGVGSTWLRTTNPGTTGKVLRVDNAGTGEGILVDQNGDGVGLKIDSEATTAGKAGLIIETGQGAYGALIEGNVGIGTTTPTEKLTVIGNASFTRNVTASNIWNTQLLSLHTDAIQCVQSSGLFQNITFNDTTKTKVGSISHNPIGITNATITIGTDGFYDMDYLIQIIDSSASPNSHVLGRITKNDVEINGTLEEYDPTRQNTDGEIQGGIIEPLNAGDQISVQFTSDDTTVCMDTDKTFGIHKDTATLKIRKVGNLIS